MANFTVSASPQITKPNNSTRRIMLDVLIALVPVAIASILLFGYHVLINILACALFCGGLETLYYLFTRKCWNREGVKRASTWDLSCFVTAVILALNLPATMNIWGMNIVKGGRVVFSFDTIIACFIGSLIAIILVKQLFGGIGKNFANPALTARVFLLLTFAMSFSSGQTTGTIFSASTGATWLSGNKQVSGSVIKTLLLGNHASAAVGETCVIALAIGYIYLAIRKVIDWRTPLMIIGWAAVFALVFDGLIASKLTGGQLWLNSLAHVLSGGLIFGAIFMATDYATSPNTFIGNCVYCFAIALFTMLIRVFASYPEGMSFAILIANILVPLIDKYIYPRPFGYVKAKKEAKND